MTNGNPTIMTLQDEGHNPADASYFMLESSPDTAPDYPSEFYRIYFVESAIGKVKLDNWNLDIQAGHLLTASPAEQVEFSGEASVRSLAFHHDFFVSE